MKEAVPEYLCTCAYNFIEGKETPTQVSSCTIYEIFKNICFEELLRTTASELVRIMG